MSGSRVFALCIDCWEFNYGITDRNGVFTRDSASSTISNGRMEMFSLACALEALQPTNGRKPSGDAKRAEEAEPHACDSPLDRPESRETPSARPQVAPDSSGGSIWTVGRVSTAGSHSPASSRPACSLRRSQSATRPAAPAPAASTATGSSS